MNYILAFDQGTTSSRSIVFDRNGTIVAFAQRQIRQIYPKPGWVEHDPHELFNSQISTAIEAIRKAKLKPADVCALGISNQRETTIVWNKRTGEPIYNAIVWQDRRTADLCDRLRETHSDLVRTRTGLEIDAYFSASKVSWLLENVADADLTAGRGELAFGTVDSWLLWKLTNGKTHATDVSNASRTMLFNIHDLDWDRELLDIFGIPHTLLPDVRRSSGFYGEVESVEDLAGIPLHGVAGDQQAALFGQACFAPGTTKSTYGTGCFMLQNTGRKPIASHNRLLTTVGWQIGDSADYALEGSVFVGGAVVQWLRDALGIIKTSAEVSELAGAASDNGGVYFVPAFVGLGTPHWDQDARGTIVGLTRGTGREHIARAALESIAFQTFDLLDSMNADGNSVLKELRVDGGAAQNDLLLQFQADILQLRVVRAKISETTALGAAYFAGLSSGIWKSTDELSDHWSADKIFEPKITAGQARLLIDRWHEAVERSLRWVKR